MDVSFLTLAATDIITAVIIIATMVIGGVMGALFYRLATRQTLLNATRDAQQQAEAEVAKKMLEGEKAAMERAAQIEQDADRQRNEVRELEKRLIKREDSLEKKEEAIEQRESRLSSRSDALDRKDKEVDAKKAELDGVLSEQRTKLQEISGLTREQALQRVLARVEEDSRHEVAKVSRQIIEKAEDEARTKATEITLQAIQRYAAETTSESTVRTVAIPSDDMKGRIIGREGRNIRAFEKATGADIIVDDTPGVIVVSCFDKVRQAIAVESLEKLIADGRMHPSRIEEIVEKTRSEVNEKVIKAGKDAALEANLRGLTPKIIEAMGKLHYRTSYGQNVLRHSIEVAFMSQIIAEQLGLDGRLARRCGFLHDIGKAMDHEMEGGHPKIGMEFARQHGEKEEAVLNAIGGHHADIPSTTFYTPIVMAADAVSSARPGARRESMERYVQRLNELQDIALSYAGVTEAYAIQAGREVRVMIDAERVSDDEAYLIAHDIAKRVSSEMTFPGEIRVTVLRETRAIEFAR
jgi:ribonucrease Y